MASNGELFYTSNHESSAEEIEGYLKYTYRLAASVALHPLQYSKTLMQLGYEPIPPRLGRSFFGKPVLVLPNIFQYASHIRRVDGVIGCYRGLTPKIIGTIVSLFASEKFAEKLNLKPLEYKENEDRSPTDKDLRYSIVYNLKRELVLSISGIVISSPFRVISVRMMAQFIGHEKIYQTVTGSIIEIWRTEGIRGFFSGLIPELLCDVTCLLLTSAVMYVGSKHLTNDVIRQYTNGFVQFFFSSLFYPLQVVSTCSTVSGTKLLAGKPPLMPLYTTWYDCYVDLNARDELRRGSSNLRRTIRIVPRKDLI